MADVNLQDFYGRVARIQEGRARGYGLEAPGTLGLSYYRKPPKRRSPIIGPLLMVLASGIALKGAIHYNVGAATFDQRIAELQSGEGFDRLGALLMQADPATLWVSNHLRDALSQP